MNERVSAVLDLMPEHVGHQPPARRPRHTLSRLVAALGAFVLLAGVVVGGLLASSRATDPFVHEDAPDVSLPASELAEFSAWAAAGTAPAAPIVLTYHDIRPDAGGSRYVVTPDAFARQLAMLAAAGYRTLTAAEFVAYQRGTFRPPPRSVLLTFDDGTAGLWRYADSILERHGFTAVSFLITQRVGTSRPYYLTWDLVQRMHESGRWDFESHTADLHVRVPGASGSGGGALTHRMLVDGHLETQAQFESRIRADLERSITDITSHGLPRPLLFAYPFSDVVARGSEGRAAAVPRAIVSSLFPVSFVDVEPGALPAGLREVRKQVIGRAEVFHGDDELSLFRKLRQMTTLPVSRMDPLVVDSHWFEDGSAHPAPVEVVGDRLRVDARTETYVTGAWAPQRTSDWIGYSVTADIAGLLPAGGNNGGITVRVGSGHEIRVQVSEGMARVSRAGARLAPPVPLRASGRHVLVVVVTRSWTRVVVDGRAAGAFPTGSASPSTFGGFGVVFSRHAADLGFPTMALRVDAAR